jgi:hypothetical protein
VIHRRPFPVAALLALAALGGDSLPKPPPEPKEPRPHDPNEAIKQIRDALPEGPEPARTIEAINQCGQAWASALNEAARQRLLVRYDAHGLAEAARQEAKLARRKYIASLLARDHVATEPECEQLLAMVEDDQALAIGALDLAAATRTDVLTAARKILGDRQAGLVPEAAFANLMGQTVDGRQRREAWFRQQERRVFNTPADRADERLRSRAAGAPVDQRGPGLLIRDARTAARMSLIDLGARLGIHHVELGEFERHRRPVDAELWVKARAVFPTLPEVMPPQQTVRPTVFVGVDAALHPAGRCTCGAGGAGGTCEWCVMDQRREKREERLALRAAVKRPETSEGEPESTTVAVLAERARKRRTHAEKQARRQRRGW